jgi:hypothetical protein
MNAPAYLILVNQNDGNLPGFHDWKAKVCQSLEDAMQFVFEVRRSLHPEDWADSKGEDWVPEHKLIHWGDLLGMEELFLLSIGITKSKRPEGSA